jgi:hypothetical protein
MKAFLRRAGIYIWHTVVCMTVFALLLGLYWCVAYSVSVHHRHRAEQMLQQLAAMDLATQNPAAVKRIARDLGAKESCFEEICNYEFGNSFLFGGSSFMRTLGRTEWDYLGLRPWQLTVVVYKGKDDLNGMQADVALGWNRNFDMWSWKVVDVTVLNAPQFEERIQNEYAATEPERQARLARDRSDGVYVIRPSLDTPGGGEAVSISLSSKAPAETRRAVFDVDLRCVTSRNPCFKMSQFVPRLQPFFERTPKVQ